MGSGTGSSGQALNVAPIVLVDDDKQALQLMTLTLKMAGYATVKSFEHGKEALDFIAINGCECAVLDMIMPGMGGLEVLERMRDIDAELPVIMATGVNEIDTAIACIKAGAYDYLVKPLEGERLAKSIANALSERSLKREYRQLAQSMLSTHLRNPGHFAAIVTQDPQMTAVFKYIEAVSPTSHPVLITGETGTGKELVARAVHAASGMSGPFVATNVAGLDDTLFSDTLFGHTKGAYTGADSVRVGLIETAANGTLFLDEIGDLSVPSQVKLLRLLQEREYRPMGSDQARRSTARVVAATAKAIGDLEASGSFRRDLFFRLCTHHVHLPPLRERKGDIELLVNSFLDKAAVEQKKARPTVPPELYVLLQAYHFPGNIRELEAMVYNAMGTYQKGILSLESFRQRIGSKAAKGHESSMPGPHLPKVIFSGELPTLKEVEDLLVKEALARAQGNQSIAAKLLGIARQSLAYRAKKGPQAKAAK